MSLQPLTSDELAAARAEHALGRGEACRRRRLAVLELFAAGPRVGYDGRTVLILDYQAVRNGGLLEYVGDQMWQVSALGLRVLAENGRPPSATRQLGLLEAADAPAAGGPA